MIIFLHRVRQGATPEPWPGTLHMFNTLHGLRPVWIGVSADGTDNRPFPAWMTVADVVAEGWPRVYLGSMRDDDEASASASDLESPEVDPDLFLYSESIDQAERLALSCCATDIVTAAYALKQSDVSLDPADGPAPCGAEAIFKWLAVMQLSDLNLHYEMLFQLLPADGNPALAFTHHMVAAASLLTSTTQRVLSWPADFLGLVDDDATHVLVANDASAGPDDVPVGTFDGGTIQVTVIISEQGDPDVVRSQDVRTFRLPATNCSEEESSSGSGESSSGSASASSSGGIEPMPFGVIYSKTSWDSTDDFTPRNGTITLVGDKIQISGGSGNFSSTVELDRPTGLEKWKVRMQYKILTTPDAHTYGIGVGVRSISSFGTPSACGRINGQVTQGQVLVGVGEVSPFSETSSPAGAIPAVADDILEVSLELDKKTLTVRGFNLTQGSTEQTATFTYDTNAPYLPNIARYGFYIFGAEGYEIELFEITSMEYKNATLMIVGDSKSKAYIPDTFEHRYASLLQAVHPFVVVNSGGYDQSIDVLAKIQEIIDFAPQRVLLNIGSNDKREGVSDATWQANYTSIVNQLIAAGIEVYHLLMLNESVLDFSAYNAFITSNFSSDHVINAGTVSLAEGVHPDTSGHAQIAAAIEAAIGSLI